MGQNKYIQCPSCSKKIRSDNMKFHKHKKVEVSKYKMKICSICGKIMKSGNLARHLKKHSEDNTRLSKSDTNKYKMKICAICGKNMISGHLARHLKNIHGKRQIVDEIEAAQKENLKRLENGKFIEEYISSRNIDPEILQQKHKEALQTKVPTPIVDVTLKVWQKVLLKYIEPSERGILWIIGRSGNEGKSWFQRYLQNLRGPSKVFEVGIKKNSDAILHALSKRIVSLIELFLFNIPRSFNMEDFPYGFIEEIKDGNAISTKYNSSVLDIKIPNSVVVFSNELPDITRMSKDRWTVYSTDGEYLFRDSGRKVE